MSTPQGPSSWNKPIIELLPGPPLIQTVSGAVVGSWLRASKNHLGKNCLSNCGFHNWLSKKRLPEDMLVLGHVGVSRVALDVGILLADAGRDLVTHGASANGSRCWRTTAPTSLYRTLTPAAPFFRVRFCGAVTNWAETWGSTAAAATARAASVDGMMETERKRWGRHWSSGRKGKYVYDGEELHDERARQLPVRAALRRRPSGDKQR